jgi:hypothetical protein
MYNWASLVYGVNALSQLPPEILEPVLVEDVQIGHDFDTRPDADNSLLGLDPPEQFQLRAQFIPRTPF